MMRFVAAAAIVLVTALAAAVAHGAAPQPRYSAILAATVRDEVHYTRTTSTEDCTTETAGSGGRQLVIKSLDETRTTGRSGTVRVELTGTRLGGSFGELRRCRFLPPERRSATCAPARIPPALARLSIRRIRPNRIALRPSGALAAATRLCGLAGGVKLDSRLQLAVGTVSERALRAGREKVVAKGSATKTVKSRGPNDPNLGLTRRITVRWTLTFRRL
jgi:hypothetical protein